MKLGNYLRKFALVWILVVIGISGIFAGAVYSVSSNADVGKTSSDFIYFDLKYSYDVHRPEWFKSSPIDGVNIDKVKSVEILTDGVRDYRDGFPDGKIRLKFNYSEERDDLVQADRIRIVAHANKEKSFSDPVISKDVEDFRNLNGTFSATVRECVNQFDSGACRLGKAMTLKVTGFERVEKSGAECVDDRSNYRVPIC